jgi:hypothetical protein
MEPQYQLKWQDKYAYSQTVRAATLGAMAWILLMISAALHANAGIFIGLIPLIVMCKVSPRIDQWSFARQFRKLDRKARRMMSRQYSLIELTQFQKQANWAITVFNTYVNSSPELLALRQQVEARLAELGQVEIAVPLRG